MASGAALSLEREEQWGEHRSLGDAGADCQGDGGDFPQPRLLCPVCQEVSDVLTGEGESISLSNTKRAIIRILILRVDCLLYSVLGTMAAGFRPMIFLLLLLCCWKETIGKEGKSKGKKGKQVVCPS